jgi:hypothetical protein
VRQWALRCLAMGAHGAPFIAELARLEAGEPVTVRGWQIGRRHPESQAWFLLEPDGTVRRCTAPPVFEVRGVQT